MCEMVFKLGAGLCMIAAGLWAMLVLAGVISTIIITICAILS